MLYTNVPKPTLPTYANTNPQGKEQYDQSEIQYDQSTVFYDGINQSLYTDVPKPGASFIYTKVNKPT